MEPTPSTRSGKASLWIIGLLLVIGGILAVVGFGLIVPQGGQPGAGGGATISGAKKFSREASLKLVELRNDAIGSLENHEFEKAEKALLEIQQLVPADAFGPRNLLICRQLALDAIDKTRYPDEFSKATSQAQEAVERAKTKEPLSHVPWVIAARVAVKLDRMGDAFTDLREAMRRGPQAVGPAYDMYVLRQTTPGEREAEEGARALAQVYKLEPNNLFVIKDWLPILAQRKDPGLVDALKQARETISPFFDTIKTHTRIDLGQTIDAAITAGSEGNWPIAQRSMTIVRNLIVSEAAREKRYVSLDSLEYLWFDFHEDTVQRLDLPETDLPPSKPVRFLPPDKIADCPTANEGRGLAITDFDLDGRTDMIVLQKDQLAAWGRPANDQPWTSIASVETGGEYTGLLAFDFDDDVDQEIKANPGTVKAEDGNNPPANPELTAIGSQRFSSQDGVDRQCHTADPDVIVFGPAGLKLFENVREPKSKVRTLVSKSAGTEFDDVRDVTAACTGDLDSDGDLDLVVLTPTGLRIFSNRGNRTFEETTARSILPESKSPITGLAVIDWDRDTNLDVLIASADGIGLLENMRHGRLKHRAIAELVSLQGSTSFVVGDFDGDASWDVVAVGPKGTNAVFTNRTPAGVIGLRRTKAITPDATRSVTTGDFDNDGGLDLLLTKDDGATIYRCDGQGNFLPVARAANDWLKSPSVIAVGDVDRDGDLDLTVIDQGHAQCLSSQCRESDNPKNQWLELQLIGEQIRTGEQNWDKRINHIGYGSLIEVKAGPQYQARMVDSTTTHFGLGTNPRAEVARIVWTNGIPFNVLQPAQDVSLCVEQKLVGSCPYLYTWNGDRFEFVTDLLWNAPLGLKFAEKVVAPWREWEYLKIDGDKLKATNQEYQLRITAELWEAEYFDQVKLFAIDHPAGTQIFTNEKVGPAELAEHRIHTVAESRRPVAARDPQGRDVLWQVVKRDGNHPKTFNKRITQGFTEEHYLELDLGEFPDARQVTLFLTGWMFPGSTSLRVQASQNPDLPRARPPAILTPDENGEWREVRPYMGFPGGKTKTIAVDVSNIFTGNDHRLRIVSSFELYWDDVFFTVDDAPVEIQQTELTMVRAELRDRGGVSLRSWPPSGYGPDRFDYTTLVPGEQWPAMEGNFTRFGDVLPLLTTRDDRLVVTGSGDEIQLAFAEPPTPVREGWVRDFVIYTVGWDKDADQNTVYGNTVEPMPFEAMTDYAHRDGLPRPADPEYSRYLREYQTRQRNPTRFWRSVQDWKRK